MINHVNSQIKNRRRNTVIARGKIINIEHNEDYSYLKLGNYIPVYTRHKI